MTPRLSCEPVWAGPWTPWHGWRVVSWFNQNQKQQKDPVMPEEEDGFLQVGTGNNKDPVLKVFNGRHSLPVHLLGNVEMKTAYIVVLIGNSR